MLNVVMYIFLILGGLLALAIIFAIIYILVNGPKDFIKEEKDAKDKNK